MKEPPWPIGVLAYVGFILVKYIAGSLLLIWALNTLFRCAIPFTPKFCLAGVTLLWVGRLFFRGLSIPWHPETDFDEEDDEEVGEWSFEDKQKLFKQATNRPFRRWLSRRSKRR